MLPVGARASARAICGRAPPAADPLACAHASAAHGDGGAHAALADALPPPSGATVTLSVDTAIVGAGAAGARAARAACELARALTRSRRAGLACWHALKFGSIDPAGPQRDAAAGGNIGDVLVGRGRSRSRSGAVAVAVGRWQRAGARRALAERRVGGRS